MSEPGGWLHEALLGVLTVVLILGAAGGAYWWISESRQPTVVEYAPDAADTTAAPEHDQAQLTEASSTEDGTGTTDPEPTETDPEPTEEDPRPTDEDPDPTDEGSDPEPTEEDTRPTEDLTTGREAIDTAYCRTRGTLVARAETTQFRAVICDNGGAMTYHGLNLADGRTITTPALADGDAWTGLGQEGVTYEVSPGAITIAQDGTELSSQETTYFGLAADEDESTRPGDLGLDSPISYPACDRSGVVVLDTIPATDDPTSAVRESLAAHPGAEYLRTDLSCDSLDQPAEERSGGVDIYVTYLAMGSDQDAICAELDRNGTHAQWLRDGVRNDERDEHRIQC